MPRTSQPSDAAGDGEAIARRLRVHGRVQGVFYRAWTLEAARARGLTGWVRNRLDGTVDVLIAGPREKVEAMIALCRQGPPAARVEKLTVESASLEDAPTPFEKRPTG